MPRYSFNARFLAPLCSVLGLALAQSACSTDLGDSSAIPSFSDGGDDSTTAEGSVSGDAQESSTPSSDGALESSTPTGADSGPDQQAMPESSTGPDVGMTAPPDTGVVTPQQEAGTPDVLVEAPSGNTEMDSGVDATLPDSAADSGSDAQAFDAGDAAETGSDAGDAGVEAGSDGSGLVPCTTQGQTGCVQCDMTAASDGVCTPTEALIVERDIAKGLVTGHALNALTDPMPSCYECLAASACIDDNAGDTDNECGDLTGTVSAGAKASETKTQACLDTLACVLGGPSQDGYTFPGGYASCANSSTSGISNCYCGSAFPTTVLCAAASGTTVTGPCAAVVLDGLGDTTATAPSMVLASITVKTNASGMADNILKCAGTNTKTPACMMCFQ